MKNNTNNIGANNDKVGNVKHLNISKNRHINFRDLLNEWNRTPPTKLNQLTNTKLKDK